KMSKSLGNVTAPEDVIREHGADILRLWVVASNYTENLTIGKNILTQHSESYRRIRNTFRWLLGVIETDPREPQEYKKSQLPLLEQYMLRRLAMLGRDIKKHADVYEFNKVFSALYRFCDQDLSAFYFDVRKDSLYCDSLDSEQRKQTMFVIDKIFDSLCKWFAPILCFTAEEAWRAHPRNKDNPDATIHMEEFPELPDEWLDGNLDEQVEDMMEIRKNVLQVLEIARKDKKIGSGLAAAVTLTLPPKIYESATAFDLADIFIVSDVKVQSGDELKIEWQAASGEKCERCWKIMPEVTQNPEKLCKRCHGVVAAM
ncbi:MAG: class I tRNA ligase family protein, partial [Hydrotalea sp.]|nr:class I tRNA ligase family protein [Hydrotalea sp.]